MALRPILIYPEPILRQSCRPVETFDGELRALVDALQLKLLGEVISYVLATGKLPPHRENGADEGVQFFRMHEDIRALLEKALRRGSEPVSV